MDYIVFREERGSDVHIVPASECRVVIERDGKQNIFVNGYGKVAKHINPLHGGFIHVHDGFPIAHKYALVMSKKEQSD